MPEIYTITPKLHIVMFHVLQYLQLQNAETGEERGLGYMSEQAFESVHSHMAEMWEKGWKVSTSHNSFGEKLRKFLVAYNSNNV